MIYLTKSDFKAAAHCPTKLYYRKERYPSALDDNPYLEFLADGGYMVEAIAKMLFPSGREVGFTTSEEGARQTQEALLDSDTVLFEATLIWESLLARVDILEKSGNSFRLIEVKAKSFDSSDFDGPTPFRGKRGAISSEWVPYLEDVTFQVHVLRKLFPDASIEPYLCLVDKSKTTTIDTIFRYFEFVPHSDGHDAVPSVRFTGDLDALRDNPFVSIVSVASEVDELIPDVAARSERLAASLTGERATRLPPTIGRRCAKCEFRVEPSEGSGFRECWKALADPSPLIIDLYQLHTFGTRGARAEEMIGEGRTALLDADPSEFTGANAARQRMQVEGTRDSREILSEALPALLALKEYPLHFVDFETSRIAVPYHAGMKPYELVAFQWSCHTIRESGGGLGHCEWLNSEDSFPNFEFARALRRAVGRGGTVFVWSHHEVTTLKEILRQMTLYGENDPELAEWLEWFVSAAGPVCDLLKLAKDYYFHPMMSGRLSIKYVLPAVWHQNPAIRAMPAFSRYFEERDGRILNPYETLPDLPFGDEEDPDASLGAVAEGTGAMRTYQEMLYGVRRTNREFVLASRQLLLNYCELDTAAMVIIWAHWAGLQDHQIMEG